MLGVGRKPVIMLLFIALIINNFHSSVELYDEVMKRYTCVHVYLCDTAMPIISNHTALPTTTTTATTITTYYNNYFYYMLDLCIILIRNNLSFYDVYDDSALSYVTPF